MHVPEPKEIEEKGSRCFEKITVKSYGTKAFWSVDVSIKHSATLTTNFTTISRPDDWSGYGISNTTVNSTLIAIHAVNVANATTTLGSLNARLNGSLNWLSYQSNGSRSTIISSYDGRSTRLNDALAAHASTTTNSRPSTPVILDDGISSSRCCSWNCRWSCSSSASSHKLKLPVWSQRELE